jgi:ankyrin repeat protein
MDEGANVDAPGKYGKTPLMYAAEAGNTDAIALLLSHDANVNARTSSGSTALTFAAENGHESVTAMLVHFGADVHDRTRAGWDSLMIAAKNGYALIVAQLLKFGADVRSSDRKGNSAMMYAIEAGHTDVIEALFEYSDLVAPCLPNHQGLTPLMSALDNERPEIVDILLPVSSNLDFTDKYGAGVLHHAVDSGSLEAVKNLLRLQNLNADIQDEAGNTALMDAVIDGRTEIVAYLLSAGVDTSLENQSGKTAKQIAMDSGDSTLASLFK